MLRINIHQHVESILYSRMSYLDVSKNRGTPKSSILIGFSIISHPFWGTPIFGNTHLLRSFNLTVSRGGVSGQVVS